MSSSVHSCEATQAAKRVSGGAPGSGSSFQAVSAVAASARAHRRGDAGGRRRDALGGDQVAHEVAEPHRVAVGDEVGAAAAAVLGGAQQPLDGVVDVRGRGAVAAAADPAERARARALDQQREQRGVAAAPDEARAHDHRLERAAALLEHDLLGHRLRARVGRLRAQRERIRLVGVHQRLAVHQHGLGADVDGAGHAGRAAGAQDAAGALDVGLHELLPGPEVLDLGGGVEADVGALHAGHEGAQVAELAADGLGAARADGVGGAVRAGERADRPPVAREALDQAPADEAGAAGDEGEGHRAQH